MKKNLIWFRNDFRVQDNTALYEACKCDKDKVLALFIATPKQWNKHSLSIKKISFIYHNLIFLKKELDKLNINLNYYKSTDFLHSVKYLIDFCQKHKINKLFYNYQYEINERNRDCLVKKKLSQKGILVQGFHDNLLIPCQYIKNKKNETYKIFSFFKKTIIKNLYNNNPICYSVPLKRTIDKNNTSNFPNFKDIVLNFDKKVFPVGEKEAINRLKNFLTNKINDYSEKRDFPFLKSTSMLSPYLASGIISSRTCLMMFKKLKQYFSLNTMSNSIWFNQILWREFYYHLLIGFPTISQSKSLAPWEKYIIWNDNEKYFHAWKEGKTGYPIVDAGMRQLNQLGWMHNRLRMITSSFLVKNLLINWRIGEKYFISQLIDGDLALNNGGWQWSASVGSDFSSYFRIFNPYNQSKKFDTSGFFIKKFLPELKTVPNNYIHNPHEWSKKNNSKINYPHPIVNYFDSKKKSLFIFNQARLRFSKKIGRTNNE